MNNKGNILVSLVALAFGIVFIWLHDHADLMGLLVNVVGLAFVIPAVISLLSLFMSKKVQQSSAVARAIQALCTVGGLGLGIVILVMPDTFRGLLVYLFALLLIVGGAQQMFQMIGRDHRADFPTWLYFPSLAVIITGVVMLVLPVLRQADKEPVMTLTAGIAFVVYAVTGILVSILRKKVKPAEAPKAADAEADKPAAAPAEPTHTPAPESIH